MSSYAIEKAFWQIGGNPAEVQSYLANEDAYLARFQLTDEERCLIKNLDVRAIADRGVNTVLLINTFTALRGGPASLGEYLQKMAGVSPA